MTSTNGDHRRHGRRHGSTVSSQAFAPAELLFTSDSDHEVRATDIAVALADRLSTRYRVGVSAPGGDIPDTAPDDDGPGIVRLARRPGATDIDAPDPAFGARDRGMFRTLDMVFWVGGEIPGIPRVRIGAATSSRHENDSHEAAPARPPRHTIATVDSIDDIESLEAAVVEHLRSTRSAPLYGLVLGGGRSVRMGTDKAAIDYHGEPQVRAAARLLAGACERVFVSIRAEQQNDAVFAGLEQIHDRFLGFGPAGGILSAMHEHPGAAWLVLGCDLPLVDEQTIRTLVSSRDPLRYATTYLSPESGLPEPMCSIFEPRFRRRFHELFAEEIDCPRKALIRSRCRTVTLENRHALDNVNDPEDRRTAQAQLSGGGAGSPRGAGGSR